MLDTKKYAFLTIFLSSLSFILILADENPSARRQVQMRNAPSNGDSTSTNISDETLPRSLPTRHSLRLSRMFDFKIFKKLFKRNYNSNLEESSRSKLFQGRALRSFISAIKYRYRISSSYLAINQMSDWTQDEIKTIYLNKPVLLLDRPYAKWESPFSSNEDLKQTDGSSRQHLMDGLVSKSVPELNIFGKSKSEIEVSERNLWLKDLIIAPQTDDFIIETLLEDGARNPSSLTDQKIDLSSEQIIDIPMSGSYFRTLSKRLSRKLSRSNRSGGYESDLIIAKSNSSKSKKVNLNVDHRKCMTPIKEQLKCSSCYAFATIALYEWAYCNATGKQLAFSEQYILDYGHYIEGLDGCRGGIVTKVGDFVDEYGLELSETYPYVAGVTIGPYSTSMPPPNTMGYVRLKEPNFWAIPMSQFEVYLEKTPLIVNLMTAKSFSEYGGGIDMGGDCTREHGYHSILIAGSGQEDGQEFWLMKNSLSDFWGESGYYRFDKKSNCIYPAWGYALKGSFNKDPSKNINKDNDPGFVKRKFVRDIKKAERAKGLENDILDGSNSHITREFDFPRIF